MTNKSHRNKFSCKAFLVDNLFKKKLAEDNSQINRFLSLVFDTKRNQRSGREHIKSNNKVNQIVNNLFVRSVVWSNRIKKKSHYKFMYFRRYSYIHGIRCIHHCSCPWFSLNGQLFLLTVRRYTKPSARLFFHPLLISSKQWKREIN